MYFFVCTSLFCLSRTVCPRLSTCLSVSLARLLARLLTRSLARKMLAHSQVTAGGGLRRAKAFFINRLTFFSELKSRFYTPFGHPQHIYPVSTCKAHRNFRVLYQKPSPDQYFRPFEAFPWFPTKFRILMFPSYVKVYSIPARSVTAPQP